MARPLCGISSYQTGDHMGSPLRTPIHHLQLPYSLPRLLSHRGGQGGGHGRGGRGWQHGRAGSRLTHTTRFPQASTPSSTSANSPGRQGFSTVTRRQWHSSGSRPGPPQCSPNTGTLTHASESCSPGSAGYSGMFSYTIITTPFRRNLDMHHAGRRVLTMPVYYHYATGKRCVPIEFRRPM